jgi:hypothetical protein
MNWVQKKICNYLWKNNWFKPFLAFDKKSKPETAKKFNEVLNKTFPVYQLTKSETEWRSYALEIAFHDKQLRKYVLSKAGFRKKYFLFFNFLLMSSLEKTELVKRIISRYST